MKLLSFLISFVLSFSLCYGSTITCNVPASPSDGSSSLQSCIDQAFNAGGGVVKLPAGNYKFQNVVVKPGVILEGESPLIAINNANWFGSVNSAGTIISQYNFSYPAIYLTSLTGLRNVTFYNSATPSSSHEYILKVCGYKSSSPYYSCTSAVERVMIKDVSVPLVSKFFYAPRLDSSFIENVRGYAVYSGIKIDESWDWVYIKDVAFNPNSYSITTEPYIGISKAYGKAFELGNATHLDDVRLINSGAFGYQYGVYISQANKVQLIDLGIEATSADGVYVGSINHIVVKGGTFFNAENSPNACAIRIDASNASIEVRDVHIIEAPGHGICIYGANNYGVISGNRVDAYSRATTVGVNALVIIQPGQFVITSNYFSPGPSRLNYDIADIVINPATNNSASSYVVQGNRLMSKIGIYCRGYCYNLNLIGNIFRGHSCSCQNTNISNNLIVP